MPRCARIRNNKIFSSVGIATRYGLDGPAIESRWRGRGGPRFSAPVQTGPGAHPAAYTIGTGSLFGEKRPGCGVDHPDPIHSTEVKERVEQYLYSTSVPSWPVLERALPFLLQRIHSIWKHSGVHRHGINRSSPNSRQRTTATRVWIRNSF